MNLPSELFGNSRILMTNLSDAAHALGEPITLELTSHETPAALKAQIRRYSSGTPHVTGTFEGFDLSKIPGGTRPGRRHRLRIRRRTPGPSRAS